MEKQNAAGSNPGVRVPPKIKIKALEAVKVRDTVAAHKKVARVALSRRSSSFAFTCMRRKSDVYHGVKGPLSCSAWPYDVPIHAAST